MSSIASFYSHIISMASSSLPSRQGQYFGHSLHVSPKQNTMTRGSIDRVIRGWELQHEEVA